MSKIWRPGEQPKKVLSREKLAEFVQKHEGYLFELNEDIKNTLGDFKVASLNMLFRTFMGIINESLVRVAAVETHLKIDPKDSIKAFEKKLAEAAADKEQAPVLEKLAKEKKE